MNHYSVYILRDPNTLAIRYVGMTSYVKTRLHGHIHGRASVKKTEWINSLKKAKKKPIFEVILSNVSKEKAAIFEKKSYLNLKKNGCDMLNNPKHFLSPEKARKCTKPQISCISATIDKDTIKSVDEIAKKEKRSFSQMVDLLLQSGIESFKKKKQ